MASKVLWQSYWTNDIKMMSKVQPAAGYWTVDQENLGTRLCYFWWAEKQRAKWPNSFKNREIFWMNNKAITEFGFPRIWRILQILEDVIQRPKAKVDNTLLDLQNSLYPSQPHSVIAQYLNNISNSLSIRCLSVSPLPLLLITFTSKICAHDILCHANCYLCMQQH